MESAKGRGGGIHPSWWGPEKPKSTSESAVEGATDDPAIEAWTMPDLDTRPEIEHLNDEDREGLKRFLALQQEASGETWNQVQFEEAVSQYIHELGRNGTEVRTAPASERGP